MEPGRANNEPGRAKWCFNIFGSICIALCVVVVVLASVVECVGVCVRVFVAKREGGRGRDRESWRERAKEAHHRARRSQTKPGGSQGELNRAN